MPAGHGRETSTVVPSLIGALHGKRCSFVLVIGDAGVAPTATALIVEVGLDA